MVLFAIGAALAVATLYYNQPMLAEIATSYHAPASVVGVIPMLTQLGYALGILLLAPLGDRYDRRAVILAKAIALLLVLVGAALAPSMLLLGVLSLLIGMFATLAQDIVPAAASLAAAGTQGRVVGKVMTGLLLGILLSRVLSGVVAAYWGWRIMFAIAAASIGLFYVVARRQLPSVQPTTRLGYGALLMSLGQLWLRYPELRRAAIAQGLLMVAFGSFWSTLAVLLNAPPFQLGSDAAGAFGLAGAAGALAAPLAGRLADNHGPARVTRAGALIASLSFMLLWLFPLVPAHGYLIVLAVSCVGFDFGMQGSLVAHQSIIYGLDPAARSRLNAVLFVSMFVCMALGSVLGSLLLAQLGWMWVVCFLVLASLGALAVRAFAADTGD